MDEAVIETLTVVKATPRMVRFTPESDAPRLGDLYISKLVPGISTAKRVEVTVRILE